MRDPHVIEREIDQARTDLEASLGELKDVARDSLDLKKQARELADRGKHKAREVLAKARERVRAEPGIAAAVAGGLLGLVVLAVFLSRRNRAELTVSTATLARLRDELCR